MALFESPGLPEPVELLMSSSLFSSASNAPKLPELIKEVNIHLWIFARVIRKTRHKDFAFREEICLGGENLFGLRFFPCYYPLLYQVKLALEERTFLCKVKTKIPTEDEVCRCGFFFVLFFRYRVSITLSLSLFLCLLIFFRSSFYLLTTSISLCLYLSVSISSCQHH